MATLKFILSKSQQQRKTNSKQSMLMLRYTHCKKTVLFSTHKNIDNVHWDPNKQRIRTAMYGHNKLNVYLRTMRQKVEDIVNTLLIEEKDPTAFYVKKLYHQSKTKTTSSKAISFFHYAENYIEKSKVHHTQSTVMAYKTVINRLKKYQSYRKEDINWSSFDMNFYYDFFQYYTEELGYLNNGFGKVIKILKVILHDAYENNVHRNTIFRHKKFKSIKEEVNNVYLTEEEIARMLQLNLSYNTTLEQIRDLFVIACYTGLRFSDFSRIKKQYISGDFLMIKTQKTREDLAIPLFDIVKDIMKKYKNSPNHLPQSFSNHTMNTYLKKIGAIANINQPYVKIRTKGTQHVEEVFYKYDLIFTHTARRSFATNMLKRGISSQLIMKITGHRTEKAFASYIKISQQENAEMMLKLFNAKVD